MFKKNILILSTHQNTLIFITFVGVFWVFSLKINFEQENKLKNKENSFKSHLLLNSILYGQSISI